MLATILSVLKIILFVLLGIIGLLLFLILLVLVWPFGYRVKGQGTENLNAKININFLFHILSIWAVYEIENGFNGYAKIFGIKVFDYNKWNNKKKLKEEKANKEKRKIKSKKQNNQNEFSDDVFEDTDDLKDLDINDDVFVNVDSDVSLKENYESKNEKNDSDLGKKNKEEKSDASDFYEKDKENSGNKDNKISGFIKKLKSKKAISFGDFLFDTFYKIWDFVESVPDKIEAFIKRPKEKIDNIVDTIVYYDNLLNKKGTQYVIEFLKKKLIKLFKHIKPGKSRIIIDYGSEDPCTVGKVLELYAMFVPYLPKGTVFTPHFDEDLIKFDVDVKGHFVLGYCGIIGLSIILNKKVRKFIKLVKRER